MKRPMVAPFDLLSAMLAAFMALSLLTTPKQHSSIDTLGAYCVTLRWQRGSTDDIDLYVRDPQGAIVYFGHRDAGAMNLEHDDLGTPDAANYERAVLRAAEAGQYVVNVHAYNKTDPAPARVRVELWRLRGSDRLLHSRELELVEQGQEETAFRFTTRGRYSTLPTSMIGGLS